MKKVLNDKFFCAKLNDIKQKEIEQNFIAEEFKIREKTTKKFDIEKEAMFIKRNQEFIEEINNNKRTIENNIQKNKVEKMKYIKNKKL